MWAVRNRTIALVVCVLVATAGCSRAEPTTPAATLGAAPSPTEVALTEPPESTEPSDPYAIPSDPKDIDKAYVERVIEALNEGVVSATGEVAEKERLTPAVGEALAATHLPQSQQGYLRSFREVLKDGTSVRQFRTRPESVEVIRVKEIGSATRDCIFALVRQDTSGLSRVPVNPFDVYYHLKAAKTPDAAANPTPWMVAADARPRVDGKEFRDPCAG